MSGMNLYCEAPKRSQGNPVRIRAIPISIATQPEEHINGHKHRAHQYIPGAPPTSLSGRLALIWGEAGFGPSNGDKVHKQNQVQVAGYKARTALTDSHAAKAWIGSGISRSQ